MTKAVVLALLVYFVAAPAGAAAAFRFGQRRMPPFSWIGSIRNLCRRDFAIIAAPNILPAAPIVRTTAAAIINSSIARKHRSAAVILDAAIAIFTACCAVVRDGGAARETTGAYFRHCRFVASGPSRLCYSSIYARPATIYAHAVVWRTGGRLRRLFARHPGPDDERRPWHVGHRRSRRRQLFHLRSCRRSGRACAGATRRPANPGPSAGVSILLRRGAKRRPYSDDAQWPGVSRLCRNSNSGRAIGSFRRRAIHSPVSPHGRRSARSAVCLRLTLEPAPPLRGPHSCAYGEHHARFFEIRFRRHTDRHRRSGFRSRDHNGPHCRPTTLGTGDACRGHDRRRLYDPR